MRLQFRHRTGTRAIVNLLIASLVFAPSSFVFAQDVGGGWSPQTQNAQGQPWEVSQAAVDPCSNQAELSEHISNVVTNALVGALVGGLLGALLGRASGGRNNTNATNDRQPS